MATKAYNPSPMNPISHLVMLTGLAGLISSTTSQQLLSVEELHSNGKINATMSTQPWNDFDQLLMAVEKNDSNAKWYDLKDQGHPLEGKDVQNLGIGLSYADHAKEVRTDDTVFFEKKAKASRLQDPIPYRPYLDYELEIALLLNRHDSRTFGYMLHNDLTDRKIQSLNYDKSDPGPGFSKSKSFKGANPVSTVIAIGDSRLWNEIEIELYRNGKKVQDLATRNNVLTPEEIHAKVFSDPDLHKGRDWVVIGTGTTAGTIFRAPSTWQKIKLYIAAGFSKEKATMLWLKRFDFLNKGDTLEIRSSLFGNVKTQVSKE